MNLLLRLIRFLAVSVFKITFGLITAISRFVILPFILATVRVLRGLVFTSLVATVNGPTQYTDQLASEWTRQVLELGLARENIDVIYALCRFLAGISIVLGWIVSALFIVVVIRVVFGLLF
jgi:hypothetical protein